MTEPGGGQDGFAQCPTNTTVGAETTGKKHGNRAQGLCWPTLAVASLVPALRTKVLQGSRLKAIAGYGANSRSLSVH
jgi:hypothetical protein